MSNAIPANMTDVTEQTNVPDEPTPTAPPTQASRGHRTQQACDESLCIYNGKLLRLFADHTGRGIIVGIPLRAMQSITDMYPMDVSYFFNEIQMFFEHYRIKNYTIRLHKRDWNYSASFHVQITMADKAYAELANKIGFPNKKKPNRGGPAQQPPPPPSPKMSATSAT